MAQANAEKQIEESFEPPVRTRIPYWRQVIDQSGITPEVENHQYAGSGTEADPFLVQWIPHDPRNPMNYSDNTRWFITMMVAFTTLAVSLLSSAYTGGIHDIVREFGISDEVAVLGVSLYVLGFALGPLLWAPLSELYGRQSVFFITYAALAAFGAGCAGAGSARTLIVLRFFAGAFGSSPLSNSGGVIADMFPDEERGLAMTLFSAAPSLGPVFGPIIGGFLGSAAGWRWLMGTLAAISGTFWLLGTALVPETYSPYLLRRRAAELSKRTGKCYVSKMEHHKGKTSLAQSFKTALSRPWKLLFREPIVLLLSLYTAIIYGTLYMLFAAFPIVYQQERGWSQGVGGLPFLGLMVGMIAAVVYSIPENNRYQRVRKRNGGRAPPETRLVSVMVGAIAGPIGLFWFAWTTNPSIHWMASVAAGVPFGFSMILLFMGISNYLIDAYTIFAASVLAANCVIRSLFGAAFPLFTNYMYKNLGTNWASSIPAFLALGCVPFPFLLYKYGAAIRARCKYAAQAEESMAELREELPQSNQDQDDVTAIEGVLSDNTDVPTSSDDSSSVYQKGDQRATSRVSPN
ncbi:major facilitator superfamily transporter [Colletotrichum graminicola]|uniref:Major facilitator superfamily transporter n=1 Tax=Colletotrichum graminicola (strain M1.001 / M2 / FGSC 10212) TaxID=645133 RepID=E3QTF8_COLGM|nr:major facilitator superfamily transporter [Colletotrichum graminicola M1.001]EFQ34146.1 major facilitator superfamily transporter [Colletotrichum graminicola M1.001]WDK18447.1 major facilitator superfamily transporter [Colletotrichum graminicola]